MYLLIPYFILFIIIALSLLTLPFIKHRQSLMSKPYIIISHFIIITSIMLYLCFGQSKELFDWLSHGKNHYELAVKFEELGGIDRLIALVKQKLESNSR